MGQVAALLFSVLLVVPVYSLDLQETGPLMGWVPGGYPRVYQSKNSLVTVVQPDPTPAASPAPLTSENRTPSVTGFSGTEPLNSTVQPGMYDPFEAFRQWQNGTENKTLLDFIKSENFNASIASAGPVLKLPAPFNFDLNASADSSLSGAFVGDEPVAILPGPKAGESDSGTVGDSYYDNSAAGGDEQVDSGSTVFVTRSRSLCSAALATMTLVAFL